MQASSSHLSDFYGIFVGIPQVQSVFACALIFGLGYSFAFPVLSLWATDLYPLAQRGRPMALFTVYFQGAIFTIPLLTGLLGDGEDFSSTLLLLAGAAGALAALLWVSGLRRQEAA